MCKSCENRWPSDNNQSQYLTPQQVWRQKRKKDNEIFQSAHSILGSEGTRVDVVTNLYQRLNKTEKEEVQREIGPLKKPDIKTVLLLRFRKRMRSKGKKEFLIQLQKQHQRFVLNQEQ